MPEPARTSAPSTGRGAGGADVVPAGLASRKLGRGPRAEVRRTSADSEVSATIASATSVQRSGTLRVRGSAAARAVVERAPPTSAARGTFASSSSSMGQPKLRFGRAFG